VDRKQVTIHYRRFQREEETLGMDSLEKLVRRAMLSRVSGHRLRDRYRSRIWKREVDGTDNLFTNLYDDPVDCVFGDVIHFSHDHMQAVFDTGQENSPVVNVEQLPAPTRREYIHSMMFWMVKGDHAFVIQSQSLTTKALEDYLGWLLTQRTRTVVPPSPVLLASKFDPGLVGGDIQDIKEIVVGGIVAPAPVLPAEEEDSIAQLGPVREVETTQTGTVATAHESGWTRAKNVLEALFGGTANVEEILRQVPAEADLSVDVHIAYKTKKRQISREPLKRLELGLRNLAEGDVRVIGKSGTLSASGDLRLQYPAGILLEGRLLNPTDVLRAFREAYQALVQNGRIEE
jgi:hypothetical protein